MALLTQLARRWRRLTLGRSLALSELDWKLRRHLNYQGGVLVEALVLLPHFLKPYFR